MVRSGNMNTLLQQCPMGRETGNVIISSSTENCVPKHGKYNLSNYFGGYNVILKQKTTKLRPSFIINQNYTLR